MYERITALIVAAAGLASFSALGGAFEDAISGHAHADAPAESSPRPDARTETPTAAPNAQSGLGSALTAAREAAARQAAAQVSAVRVLAEEFPGSAVAQMAHAKKYFASVEEFVAQHVPGAGYHDATHSAEVSAMVFDLAKRRGLADAEALFLSEVGLVHDLDPARPAGTAARVQATRDALGGIAARMGWDERRRLMADALIHRTSYPFDAAAGKVYETLLRRLHPNDQRFVLREGAVLSEYADKGSNYMLRPFGVAQRKVIALARELDPTGKLRGADLNTGAFLAKLGLADAFSVDAAVATRVLGSARGLFGLSRERLGQLAPELLGQLELNRALFDRLMPPTQ